MHGQKSNYFHEKMKQQLQRMPFIMKILGLAIHLIGHLPMFHPMRKVRPIVMLYPSFVTEEELLDAYYKARFFLPPEYISQIIIPIKFQPSFRLTHLTEWPRPAYFADLKLPEPYHVKIIKYNPTAIWYNIFQADYLFLWDWTAIHKNRWLDLHRAKLRGAIHRINPIQKKPGATEN
jgi:hypothetical protein